ncbi:MAG TPA: hypothetical protein P5551_11610 [Syntrophales bacterium]|jgi:hypothetical protein|nr:hypothetical protein [Syntrophales bacterium]HRT62995.1 hypothetical protein [Syntrophales bacterium]
MKKVKKIMGGTACVLMAMFLVVFPVQAYIRYFDLRDPVGDLISLLLVGPALAIAAGIGRKMKTG